MRIFHSIFGGGRSLGRILVFILQATMSSSTSTVLRRAAPTQQLPAAPVPKILSNEEAIAKAAKDVADAVAVLERASRTLLSKGQANGHTVARLAREVKEAVGAPAPRAKPAQPVDLDADPIQTAKALPRALFFITPNGDGAPTLQQVSKGTKPTEDQLVGEIALIHTGYGYQTRCYMAPVKSENPGGAPSYVGFKLTGLTASCLQHLRRRRDAPHDGAGGAEEEQ